MVLKKHLGEQYTPLYFLASLGNGGLVVTFFMYMMFMVPRSGVPMTTFEVWWPHLTGGNLLLAALIVLSIAGILFFTVRHYWTLIWNIREYIQFKRTPAYARLRESNAETSLMAIPLTLAMSINVGFILGAVFVPGLWSVVEYLFPLALLAFFAVGVYAMHLFLDFFTHRLIKGHFDCTMNNNLSQMIVIFAFAMVGVGFAAPAYMSNTPATFVTAAFASIFFVSIAVVLGLMKFVLGFRAMMEHGISREQSVSLWVIIPILTLFTITFIRLTHSLEHHFGVPENHASLFVLTSVSISLQIMFGMIGYMVMRQLGYFREFVGGSGRSPGSYALICPGVALFVLGMFFMGKGLVLNNVLSQFSPVYFAIIAPLIYVQIKTILVMFKLDHKLLKPEPGQTRTPETTETTETIAQTS